MNVESPGGLISALNDSGENAVDWWFMYKLPEKAAA